MNLSLNADRRSATVKVTAIGLLILALLIPIAVFFKFAGDSEVHFPPQIEQFQSILMLLLAISGTYLYLLPYIVKSQRKRKKAKSLAAAAQ